MVGCAVLLLLVIVIAHLRVILALKCLLRCRRCSGSASARRGIRMLVFTVFIGEPPCISKSKTQGGPGDSCSTAHCESVNILLRLSACCARGRSLPFQSDMMSLSEIHRASAITRSSLRPRGLLQDPQFTREVRPALSNAGPKMWLGSTVWNRSMAIVTGMSSFTNISCWIMGASSGLQHPVT